LALREALEANRAGQDKGAAVAMTTLPFVHFQTFSFFKMHGLRLLSEHVCHNHARQDPKRPVSTSDHLGLKSEYEPNSIKKQKVLTMKAPFSTTL